MVPTGRNHLELEAMKLSWGEAQHAAEAPPHQGELDEETMHYFTWRDRCVSSRVPPTIKWDSTHRAVSYFLYMSLGE